MQKCMQSEDEYIEDILEIECLPFLNYNLLYRRLRIKLLHGKALKCDILQIQLITSDELKDIFKVHRHYNLILKLNEL